MMNEKDMKDHENVTDNAVQDEKGVNAENLDAVENKEEQKVADTEAKGIEDNDTKGDDKENKDADIQKKCDELNDKYLRLAAEFDNYRRRSSKERLELISSAGEDVIKGLLPVLDDCERALKVLKESKDVDAAKEGTELIYNKLMAFLKGRGLAVIESRGKELDTDLHEAAAQFPVEDKDKKNKIIDVIQEGYTLNGKVIRFAKVVVGI